MGVIYKGITTWVEIEGSPRIMTGDDGRLTVARRFGMPPAQRNAFLTAYAAGTADTEIPDIYVTKRPELSHEGPWLYADVIFAGFAPQQGGTGLEPRIKPRTMAIRKTVTLVFDDGVAYDCQYLTSAVRIKWGQLYTASFEPRYDGAARVESTPDPRIVEVAAASQTDFLFAVAGQGNPIADPTKFKKDTHYTVKKSAIDHGQAPLSSEQESAIGMAEAYEVWAKLIFPKETTA